MEKKEHWDKFVADSVDVVNYGVPQKMSLMKESFMELEKASESTLFHFFEYPIPGVFNEEFTQNAFSHKPRAGDIIVVPGSNDTVGVKVHE